MRASDGRDGELCAIVMGKELEIGTCDGRVVLRLRLKERSGECSGKRTSLATPKLTGAIKPPQLLEVNTCTRHTMIKIIEDLHVFGMG